MNIKLKDILIVGTDTKFIQAIVVFVGKVPIFSEKGGIMEHISDTLSLITSSYMYNLEINIPGYLYDPGYFPHKNSIYQFFSCGLSWEQEYCTPSIEYREEVGSSQADGIYLRGDTSLEDIIDIDRQSYIIGTIVGDNMPVLLPPLGIYLRNYFTNNRIDYAITYEMKQLKVGDLYIPIWEKDVEIGKKYKYSCKFFQSEGFHPEFAGCLELDGLLTSIDFDPEKE